MTSTNDGSDGEKIVVLIDAGLEELIPGFLENRQSELGKMREALVSAVYDTI